jgi:hypothetical protein
MTTHSMLLAAAIGCTILTTSNLSAQTTDSVPVSVPKTSSRWAFLVNSGTLVPTGAQRDVIKRGSLTAAQLTYVARSSLAITSTVGWARSRDITSVGDPKLDVFTYDIGAEVRAPRSITGNAVTFTPFAGAGAGGRSYDYRKLDIDATHNLAAYGSVGGELGVRRVRVRLEARDYVTAFKPLSGSGAARTGNDVVLMAGVRFASR